MITFWQKVNYLFVIQVNLCFKVIWAKSGDILALGSTKINSDTRLTIQHRYVSEWHLIIDNVATDDEGEYVCKTNGDFYKTIHLQVLSESN